MRRRYTGLSIWFEQILLESFLNICQAICQLLYAPVINLFNSLHSNRKHHGQFHCHFRSKIGYFWSESGLFLVKKGYFWSKPSRAKISSKNRKFWIPAVVLSKITNMELHFLFENVRKYFELQDNSDRKEIETGWKSDNCMVNSGSTLLNNY